MEEDRRDNSVLQTEINGLKELFTEKINNLIKLEGISTEQNSTEHTLIEKAIKCNDDTLKEHNGRLRTMEQAREQIKGASQVVKIGWIIFSFIVGGLIFPVILKLIEKIL